MQQAIDTLKDGGIILHATETCYGFTCDITNQQAVQQLFMLKKRDAAKPVSALFADATMAKQYVRWNETTASLANEHLPGPLTMIVAIKDDAPDILYPTPNGGSTIGVRISSYRNVQQLVEQYGKPLVTTSANIAGLPCCYNIADVLKQFGYTDHINTTLPFLIVDHQPLPAALPSTVVDCTNNKITIVRNGVIEL